MIAALVALALTGVAQAPSLVAQAPDLGPQAPDLGPQAPDLGAWVTALGPPTKSVEETDRVRDAREPLMLYWMRAHAAPLGVGPAVPGTLVANFAAASDRAASALVDFTFLARASPREASALVAALRGKGWIAGEAVVHRSGGRFSELTLALPDGRRGTMSLRLDAARGAMADGRPSPTLWMHVHR